MIKRWLRIMQIICMMTLCCNIVMAQNNKVVVIPLGDNNLTKSVHFNNSHTSTSLTNLTTCSSRTVIKMVAINVPKSANQSHVVCRATGKTFHSQTGKWVLYGIDNTAGAGQDVFAYTGIGTSTETYSNYDSFAMQEVYTILPAGGVNHFYLKACRQDTSTTGTAYHDDFICELYPG